MNLQLNEPSKSTPLSIDDLPEELMEYILSLVCPYKDLENCKIVSKRWNSTAKRVIRRKQCSFLNSLINYKLVWGQKSYGNLSPRINISTCYVDGIVYLFGGCSETYTEFNDLISIDMSDLTMKRIISSGNIPSPKSSATLCAYKNKLILYGGCAYTSRTTQFQDLILFNELHVYDIKNNVWKKYSDGTEMRVTSHSATVHRNLMIVLGGITSDGGIVTKMSQEVRCLNLDTFVWTTVTCCGDIPHMLTPRLLSQVFIDDDHLLLFTRTPNAYLLTMNTNPWRWSEVKYENTLGNSIISPPVNLPVIQISGYLITINVDYDRKDGMTNSHNGDVVERKGAASDFLCAKPKMYLGDIRNILDSKKIIWSEPRSYSEHINYCPFSMYVGNAKLLLLGTTWQYGEIGCTTLSYAEGPKFTL